MKVFVLNLRSHYKKGKAILKFFAIAMIFVILASLGAKAYLESDAYEEAISSVAEKVTVILDAGHGGEDCGAIGVNGVYEKDLNMSIATKLGEMLSSRGFAVVYTRTTDALLYTEEENIHGMRKIYDLKNRCKIGAEYPNAIYISIHMNSYKSAECAGLQVYYSENNDESRNLAGAVQSSVRSELQRENNRQIKKGKGIYLMENLNNPAILIECGFLTNPKECEKLSEKEYQKELSFAIICGIIEYTSNR